MVRAAEAAALPSLLIPLALPLEITRYVAAVRSRPKSSQEAEGGSEKERTRDETYHNRHKLTDMDAYLQVHHDRQYRHEELLVV